MAHIMAMDMLHMDITHHIIKYVNPFLTQN